MSYHLMYCGIMGEPLQINKSSMGSNVEIDDLTFMKLGHLYFDKRNSFLELKQKTQAGIAAQKYSNFEVYSVLGYINYIEGNFKTAIDCFQKALKFEFHEQGTWLFLAFCFRQLDNDAMFERILNKISIQK